MIRRRINFANVTSFVALFVALSAGSYAAVSLPANSVGSKQLKAKSVTSGKLRNGAVNGSKIASNAIDSSKVQDHSLTGSDINLGALGKVPSAATADTATSATTATTATTAGSAAIARVKTVTAGGTSTAWDGSSDYPVDDATATCDSGLVAIGGGVELSDPNSQLVVDSFPHGGSSWKAHVLNHGFDMPTFTVHVICAPAAATS